MSRCHSLGTTSPECWDLLEKIDKARRTAENAEYRYYERGIWPKHESRAQAEARIAKHRAKANALEEEARRRGC